MKKLIWKLRDPLGRKPRGGWIWKEEGASSEAKSLEGLYTLIQLAREREGLSCDGLRQEMIDYFCARDPHIGMQVEEEISGSPDETPEERAIAHIKHLLTLKLTYTDFPDTKKRRKICKRCPHNNRTPYIQKYTKEKIFQLTRGSPDDFLGTCDKFHHDNSIATCVEPEPGILQPDNLPDECWIGKL